MEKEINLLGFAALLNDPRYDNSRVTFSFETDEGYLFTIWEKESGAANNEILYKCYLPEALNTAVNKYISGLGNKPAKANE
jgi:hypothetical protein